MTMRTMFSTTTVLAILLSGGSVIGQTTAPRNPQTTNDQTRTAAPSAADKLFMTKAAMGGEAEVELAALAQQKGSNAKVKALGERLETDHKKANAELQTLMTAKGVSVPSAGEDKEHQALRAKLEKLDGAAFDSAYASAMVEDHVKDVKAFETAAKSSDPAVKDFASKTLPTLREHLKMAQDTQAAVGAGQPNVKGTSGNGAK